MKNPLRLTEKLFSQQVEELLDILHWRWCHFRPARTERGWRTALSGHVGLPDYVATKDGRLLIFELKSDSGKVSLEQQIWLTLLQNCAGVEVYLWRPANIDIVKDTLQHGGTAKRPRPAKRR